MIASRRRRGKKHDGYLVSFERGGESDGAAATLYSSIL